MVRYLKRLKSSKFVRVKAFPMYGGIGVSAPSLHRESTDSLILCSSTAVINDVIKLSRLVSPAEKSKSQGRWNLLVVYWEF